MKAVVPILLSLLVWISCSKAEGPASGDKKPAVLHFFASSKKMVRIDSGSYKAFIGQDSGRVVRVEAFMLDESPVTNREFLQFVRENPQWSKSRVIRLYADSTYLKSWPGDYEIPKNCSGDTPVTNVSWYAAKAYAKSIGKRLPTVAEWEFAALADEKSKNASEDPKFTDFILRSYEGRRIQGRPVKQQHANYYGLYDMYDLVWEWTEDFNSVMVSGESRNDNTPSESLFCAAAAITSSDLRNYAAFMRYALRGSLKASYCLNNLGFRCAKSIKN